MKRHLVIAGRGLAGIGLASVLAYLVATVASGTKHPPVWPYLVCGGITITGIITYFVGCAGQDQNGEPVPKSTPSKDSPKPTQNEASSKPLPGEAISDSGASNKTTNSDGKRIRVRYFLAVTGLIVTALGLYALVTLTGRPQALVSALIIIGLVLIAASILDFKRSAITIELVLAILGVITLPYTVWTLGGQSSNAPKAACTNGIYAHQPVPLKWIPYRTDSYPRFSLPNGIHTLFYPDLRWAAYYISLPDQLCKYTISFFAREVGPAHIPVVGNGWGYALGACDKALLTIPAGFSFQYALYQQTAQETIGAFEVVHLPKANTFPNGVGQEPPYPLDYKWHQWTLSVANNQVAVTFDDDYKVAEENLTGEGLPSNCSSSGIFLRVWGGTAQFNDLTVAPNQ